MLFTISTFLVSSAIFSAVSSRQIKYRQEFKPTSTAETATVLNNASSPTNIPEAVIHYVDVGKEAFTFSPNIIQAAIGDFVEFYFYAENHSVAESTFQHPCHPKTDTDPILSGFVPIHHSQIVKSQSENHTNTYELASRKFVMQINNTDPIWLYCSQKMDGPDHCEKEQVMVINPVDGSNQTLDAYKDAASKSTNTISPDHVHGGVFIKILESSDAHLNSPDHSNDTVKMSAGSVAHEVGVKSQMALLMILGAMAFAFEL